MSSSTVLFFDLILPIIKKRLDVGGCKFEADYGRGRFYCVGSWDTAVVNVWTLFGCFMVDDFKAIDNYLDSVVTACTEPCVTTA